MRIEPIVGKRYSTNDNSSINERFRSRKFTVLRIDARSGDTWIKFDGLESQKCLSKTKWDEYVITLNELPWDGNVLKFKFVIG